MSQVYGETGWRAIGKGADLTSIIIVSKSAGVSGLRTACGTLFYRFC